jgi:AraC-like DNA-binding protein
MNDIRFDFVELESDESFELLARTFGGTLQENTIWFDNPVVKGEVVKRVPEKGLWIRKWKLTVYEKIILHRDIAPSDRQQKFNLIYFLNPSLFHIKNQLKKVPLNTRCNNLFASNELAMDFSAAPKLPFYVVDISFTVSWLLAQFKDAEPGFKLMLEQHLRKGAKTLLMAPCLPEDYQNLNEVDSLLQTDQENLLSVRARIYSLLSSFFDKTMNQKAVTQQKQYSTQYHQIVEAEAILMKHLQKAPTVEALAQYVNMSPSSLYRQFKAFYGKSLYEYYIEKKMELAKKMIIEDGLTVKHVAHLLGYNQGSPFIAMFKKQYGCCPGLLKS